MSVEKTLQERSDSTCELCTSTDNLAVVEVSPSNGLADTAIYVCSTCSEMISDKDAGDVNHWRCLNESMWSTQPAVQVTAYRLLKRIASEGWPQDMLDMLFLEDDVQAYADDVEEERAPTRDSNGVELLAGDTVNIIKDLEVKGAGFTAKRGTAVRNISLTNNPTQIEGRVNGTKIVLLTQFLKKA